VGAASVVGGSWVLVEVMDLIPCIKCSWTDVCRLHCIVNHWIWLMSSSQSCCRAGWWHWRKWSTVSACCLHEGHCCKIDVLFTWYLISSGSHSCWNLLIIHCSGFVNLCVALSVDGQWMSSVWSAFHWNFLLRYLKYSVLVAASHRLCWRSRCTTLFLMHRWG